MPFVLLSMAVPAGLAACAGKQRTLLYGAADRMGASACAHPYAPGPCEWPGSVHPCAPAWPARHAPHMSRPTWHGPGCWRRTLGQQARVAPIHGGPYLHGVKHWGRGVSTCMRACVRAVACPWPP
eukprot:256190-Chlamydomonas_euryale.AAC.7